LSGAIRGRVAPDPQLGISKSGGPYNQIEIWFAKIERDEGSGTA